jgi:uncharacterized Fe-S cluster-containing radical SAM superfamily protein
MVKLREKLIIVRGKSKRATRNLLLVGGGEAIFGRERIREKYFYRFILETDQKLLAAGSSLIA